MFNRGRLSVISFMLALIAGGCGDRSKPPTVVKGSALYRGEPIEGGMVVFAPNPERGCDGPLLVGTIQMDGTFTLTTDDGQSPKAGWYRVGIAPKAGVYEVPTPHYPYPGPPPKYRNPARSGLEREVFLHKENTFHFDLDDY